LIEQEYEYAISLADDIVLFLKPMRVELGKLIAKNNIKKKTNNALLFFTIKNLQTQNPRLLHLWSIVHIFFYFLQVWHQVPHFAPQTMQAKIHTPSRPKNRSIPQNQAYLFTHLQVPSPPELL
jgi:hypothetical protein